ncbi:isocitrate lyase/phosphoenolpyruvate mutase family protein [Frankia sp. Cr1]|uniref:isocitrate lyase/PEP mutase family protein n=1 Tax=Frankia sp. Cr1 TaxID=3073931 RepID=UPI002AD5653F|nr:isocitrate lyase/phosphoenolpyruvate mutase family protein [Frankia sp. Cr1]
MARSHDALASVAAARLRELHVPGKPLVLPNVWDADSARSAVAAGFPVVATSSVAVAESLGYSDGENAPVDDMFDAASRIMRAVDVPVTVDVEAGYGLAAAELVDRLLGMGAAGCNIEDTDHEHGCLRNPGEHAELLAAIRQHAGANLVINARVDSFLYASDESTALPDAVERARCYVKAGVDCVYPIHAVSRESITAIVTAISPTAVNTTYLPGAQDVAGMTGLGVTRISLGAGLWRAGQRRLRDTLEAMSKGTMPY